MIPRPKLSPKKSCSTGAGENKSLVVLLAVLLLVYFVVLWTINNCAFTRSQASYAEVRPIFVSSGIQIGLSKCNNNGEISLYKRVIFFLTENSIRAKRVDSCFKMTSRYSRGDIDSRGTIKYYRRIFTKPLVRTIQRILSKEDITSHTNLYSRGFSIITAMQINNNLLVWSDHKWNRSGHNIRALIAQELSPAFLQRIFSSFCKTAGSSSLLSSLRDKHVRLLSIPSHLVELPVHRVPLEISNAGTDNGRKGNNQREAEFPFFISLKSLLKGGYLVGLILIADGIGRYGMSYAKRPLYLRVLSLLVFAAIGFHFAWVLLFV